MSNVRRKRLVGFAEQWPAKKGETNDCDETYSLYELHLPIRLVEHLPADNGSEASPD
jgi:hypothetical protein